MPSNSVHFLGNTLCQRAYDCSSHSKTANIPWQDKVFRVHSFQGNEDDFIVSTVRTEKLGFLAESRRVNVMLSRCKKGLHQSHLYAGQSEGLACGAVSQ
ncbi:hypothetical protein B0H10DRAFT_2065077 [Mycena sp. CBHHK59/15]|nr:hypothetical protein B0H10DRAFT_2065077 [Mycena sp. CBHHK59/15]